MTAERIQAAMTRIDKLTAKLNRIDNALASGVNPYYYEERDRRQTQQDLDRARETLAKEINKNNLEQQLEAEKIEAIEIFLDEWEKKAIEYFKRTAMTIRVELRKVEGKPYKERTAFGEQLINQYGKLAYQYATYNFGNIEKDIARDKKAKREIFYKRIKEITGRITDACGLRIGDNGEINGTAIGEAGRASVETISAGGYNVQCFHYRVLVKKI